VAQVVRYYPVHLLLGLAIVVLQSTLLAKTGHQNILLILVLHLAGTGQFFAGGLLTLFFGLLQDTLSGAPAGLSSLFYLLVFFGGSLFRRGLTAGHPFYQMGLVLVAGTTLTVVLSWIVNSSLPSIIEFVSIFFTVLVSPFLFHFFNFMESLYSRVSRPKSID
jgi:hypothetical protein